jgi:hypothetical protein
MFRRSILAVILLATTSLLAQKTLTATEAKDHIGEQETVCGKVVSTLWAESSRGRPTFLNFDKPYPDQILHSSSGEVTARSLVSQKPHTGVRASV